MQVSNHRLVPQIAATGLLAMLVTLGTGQERALAGQQTVAQNRDATPAHADLTFTRDIAPILQQNCQVCHQDGAIGPMPLMTYQDVRRYARRITRMVEAGEMPPYQYDTDVGIQELKYDPRMSPEDIEKIAIWVEAGSPEGDPADMPAPVEWPDPAEWRLAERFGQPDVIVRSEPYDVPPRHGCGGSRPRGARRRP